MQAPTEQSKPLGIYDPTLRIRKAIRIGHSHAVTLDPKWVKANGIDTRGWVTTGIDPTGRFIVYPQIVPATRAANDATPPG